MKQLLKDIQHNKLLWLLAFVPVVFAAQTTHARRAHAALRPVRSGHRPVDRAAEPRHRVGGRQDRRCDRWPAERHARQPGGTGHRAGRLARRAIHAGEGVHCRHDCHQHVVHPGCVVSAGRTQAPRAGIQPGQRPHAGGTALPGHGRVADSFGHLACRHRRGGVQPQVERGPRGAAHRHLRTEHAVLAQDAPRVVWQRATCRGRRRAVADGRGPGARSPASRSWSRS